MKKYLFIILLVGVCFLDAKTKYNKELSDYYLGNEKNFQSLDLEDQNVINNELKQIFENSDNKLNKLLLSKDWVYFDEYETYFDKDGWIKESLKRGYRSGDRGAEDLKLAYNVPVSKTKAQLKNRSVIIFENNKSKYGISRKSLILENLKPSWSDLVNDLGYSQLGELGVSKSNSSIFNLIKAIYKLEFVKGDECLVESKYFGDDYAFQYHDKLNEDLLIETARFEISKVDYNIIRGKKTPKIKILLKDHEIVADLYKLDPKIKKSMDSSFTNYRKVIYNMMYDLIGEELELKNKKEAAIKEKEREKLIKRLEPIANDARKIKALMEKKAKEKIDLERDKFIKSKYHKHSKEKKGKNIYISFNGLMYLEIYLYENNQIYSSTYIKSGKERVKIRKVKPNTQYEVYLITKKNKYITDNIIAKKVVTIKDEDISLKVLIADFKDIDSYLEEFEKTWFDYASGYQIIMDMYSKNKGFNTYRLSKDLTKDYYNYLTGKPMYFLNECNKITFPVYKKSWFTDSGRPTHINGWGERYFGEGHYRFCSIYDARRNFYEDKKEKTFEDPIITYNKLKFGNGTDKNGNPCDQCIKMREMEKDCLSRMFE